MEINELPKYKIDKSETGCCPRFYPEPWNKKMFEFKELSLCSCRIFLRRDAIKYIEFKNPIYDPELNLYTIKMSTSENVERYYAGDPEEKMKVVIDRYKKYHWHCIRKHN